jgi:hypothetical protein
MDDPRIKRVLKRYRKGAMFFDSSMDLTNFGLSELLQACRCSEAALAAPRELDEHALTYFADRMGIVFDQQQFDYFLHSYVRAAFVSSYYGDTSARSFPAREDGPPPKVPIPKGMYWRSVRPVDGEERYEACALDEPSNEA